MKLSQTDYNLKNYVVYSIEFDSNFAASALNVTVPQNLHKSLLKYCVSDMILEKIIEYATGDEVILLKLNLCLLYLS